MKKVIFYFILSVVMFCSCSKQLDQDPISSATTVTFYSSTNDFIQGVNSIYADLMTYPDRQLNLSETRSDNLYAVSDGGVRDWEGINDFYSSLAGNPYISEAWATNYNGIYRANVLLEQLQKNGKIITDGVLRSRLKAEAKFLRAFYYFDLVRWFGKVPIIDHSASAAEANTIPRSSVADLYKLIISDLQFACDSLSPTYASADKGHATTYSAKGLLALVYMTESGPTYGIEGPGLGLNEWNKAESLLNDIISSNKYSFLSSYPSIFSYTNENNAEVIFNVEYKTGSSPVVGATFPWLLVPDNYFQSLGKATQGGLYIRPVSTDLVNLYETGDTRKNFTIKLGGFTYNGTFEDRPFFQKYVDLTKVPTNRLDWPINFIVQRYTDILMLKAECILHGADGTQTDVDNIVNQVRQRAGLTAVSNVTLKQLMDERRREFAAEGLRWHDLVRSGLVESTINAWIPKEDILHAMQTFKKEYIIYPIPQSELDVNPGLYTQNAGYQ
ncbi:MAG: RagB/SusD family nutrient uptake outer membrane protein [Bacteroidota bacterium]|nr:RagB/SusD family nutrient uptake outer membrane protein [Bacteroidota bacterium]